MPDASALADEIGGLFIGVAKDIYTKFKQEDKDDLTKYAKSVAELILQLQVEQNPAKRKVISDNLETYKNATSLMVARYEMIAANSIEKAGIAALKVVVNAIVKILVAAL